MPGLASSPIAPADPRPCAGQCPGAFGYLENDDPPGRNGKILRRPVAERLNNTSIIHSSERISRFWMTKRTDHLKRWQTTGSGVPTIFLSGLGIADDDQRRLQLFASGEDQCNPQ